MPKEMAKLESEKKQEESKMERMNGEQNSKEEEMDLAKQYVIEVEKKKEERLMFKLRKKEPTNA